MFIDNEGKSEFIDGAGIARSPTAYDRVSSGAVPQEVKLDPPWLYCLIHLYSPSCSHLHVRRDDGEETCGSQ